MDLKSRVKRISRYLEARVKPVIILGNSISIIVWIRLP